MKKRLSLLVAVPLLSASMLLQAQQVDGFMPAGEGGLEPIEPVETYRPPPTIIDDSAAVTQPLAADDYANLPVAKAQPADTREITTRLQIFLDQQKFGPGKIDGAPGEFTAKALMRYQRANGLPITTENLDNIPLDSVHPIYITYTITEEDAKRVGSVPRKPEDQAKLKRLPYPSLLKFLVERFHSDPNFLQAINRNLDLSKLAPGDTVRVPNVAPFKIEEVRAVGKVPVVERHKARRIVIDTREKILDLMEGQTLIASFPITPGSGRQPAPAGSWRILGIATLPWYRHDEGVLNHGVRTSNFYSIPAGPSNPVGVVWIGLNKPGIGIHGTNNPLTIGRAASHGCIRLANWDAIRLVPMITEGMTVVIDGETVADAR